MPPPRPGMRLPNCRGGWSRRALVRTFRVVLRGPRGNFVPAAARDADAEGLEGMSASKMRDAAAKDDFKAFAKGIPNIGNMDKKNLYNILQKSMGVKKREIAQEDTWQYAPKLDPFGLRIAYLKEKVFKVGSLVENVNTGVRGRITRRCSNCGENWKRRMMSNGTHHTPLLNLPIFNLVADF